MNHANILRYTRFQILFPAQRHSAFCGDRTNRSAPGPGLAPSMEGVGIPSYPSKRNRCPNCVHTRAELANPVSRTDCYESVRNSEIVEQGLVVVLRRETGVAQIFAYGWPLLQTSVVEHLEIIGDDEGNDAGRQALLEHHKSSDTAVAVLKRVDAFETLVQVENVVERLVSPGVVLRKESLHLTVHLLGRRSLHAADLVGQTLVVAHGEPLLAAVRRAGLELCVQFLDEGFGERFFGPVDNRVDAAKVVRGFEDIVHAQRFALDAHRVGLEDVAGLVVGQPAAFDVVRVVGEVDLRAVVDAALETHLLLLAQHLQQRHDMPGSQLANGQCGIRRDVPGLARKKGSLDLSRGAVVASRAFRDAVFCGKCRD